MRPVDQTPKVTAGLKWPPETAPSGGDHHGQRQAVRERHPDQPPLVSPVNCPQYDGTDADEEEEEGADRLGNQDGRESRHDGADLSVRIRRRKRTRWDVAPAEGFEPPTPALGRRRSIH